MKQGSADAFERCYQLISPQIYTVIYKVCRNKDTSQVLLQDTFIDIFEKEEKSFADRVVLSIDDVAKSINDKEIANEGIDQVSFSILRNDKVLIIIMIIYHKS